MLRYAKTIDNKMIFIDDAESKTDYFFKGAVVIARKGKINKNHFALKNTPENLNKKFISNMSDEHLFAQYELLYSKTINIGELTIKASYADDEVYIGNRIIDVVFYDENDKIICLIEVVKTSDLTEDKIEDLKDYNIIRYDINPGSRSIKFVQKQEDERLKRRIKESKYEFHNSESGEIREIREDISFYSESMSKVNRFGDSIKITNENIAEKEREIKVFEEERRRRIKEGKQVFYKNSVDEFRNKAVEIREEIKKKIKYFEELGLYKKTISIEEEIGRVEQEIREYQRSIRVITSPRSTKSI
jgi:hypothetical protein